MVFCLRPCNWAFLLQNLIDLAFERITSLRKMWLEDLTADPTGSRASWPDFIGERTEDLLQRWVGNL